MSSSRKLQGEIERTIKKVAEGIELFDEIWDKVYAADQPSLREKYEGELKKEIKKLQRLRDQIKNWIAGNEVKDKKQLIENRKIIESRMEKFKQCERESKTKAYSNGALAKSSQNAKNKKKAADTPEKKEARELIEGLIATIEELQETAKEELGNLQRARKPDQAHIARIEESIDKHQKYASALSDLIDLMNYDMATPDEVNGIKDGVEYYISDSQDPDFVEDEALFELVEQAKEKASKAAEEAGEGDEDEDGDGDEDGEDEEQDDLDEEADEDEDEEEPPAKPVKKPEPAKKPAVVAPVVATKVQEQAPKKQEPAVKQPTPTPAAASVDKKTTPVAATPVAPTVADQKKAPNTPTVGIPQQAPQQPQLNFGALVKNQQQQQQQPPLVSPKQQAPLVQQPVNVVAKGTPAAVAAQQQAAANQKQQQQQQLPVTPTGNTPVILQQQQQAAAAAQQQQTAAAAIAAANQKQQQQQQQAAAAAAQQQQQKKGAQVPKVQPRPQQGVVPQVVQQKPLSYMEVIAKNNPQANQQQQQQQQQQLQQQQQASGIQTPTTPQVMDENVSNAAAAVDDMLASRMQNMQLAMMQQQQQQLQQQEMLYNGGSLMDASSLSASGADDDVNDETFGSAMVAPTIGSLEDFASQTIDVAQKDMPLFALGLDNSQELKFLDVSLDSIPYPADTEQPKLYHPPNPYKTPDAFPSEPTSLFNDPSIIGKMDTDTLFFIFYFQQGTYQQYLAAKELKRQAWRYHKKYTTWFQRHDTPKQTTNEFELGTYVYFDYESHDGWCQRIKSGFRFEYEYLEDENL